MPFLVSRFRHFLSSLGGSFRTVMRTRVYNFQRVSVHFSGRFPEPTPGGGIKKLRRTLAEAGNAKKAVTVGKLISLENADVIEYL